MINIDGQTYQFHSGPYDDVRASATAQWLWKDHGALAITLNMMECEGTAVYMAVN